MARYLHRELFESALNRGKAIECFLGGGTVGSEPTIRWVSILRRDNVFVAQLWEAWDPRQPEQRDVYSFATVSEEPDEPRDERTFQELEAGLEFVITEWRAEATRFVNEGVVQDEYADYLSGKWPVV